MGQWFYNILAWLGAIRLLKGLAALALHLGGLPKLLPRVALQAWDVPRVRVQRQSNHNFVLWDSRRLLCYVPV